MRNCCYTQQQICLMNQLRNLWEQHVYWTRFFIISTAAELGDLESVTNRLLRNPKDFAKLFAPIYGAKSAGIFEDLFTQHLLIAADLVNAAKAGDSAKADDARRRWYRNADEIAAFLACTNPFWKECIWKAMLYSHLDMTEKEAVLRLKGDYVADIQNFDQIEEEALKMADYMFCGTSKFCAQKGWSL